MAVAMALGMDMLIPVVGEVGGPLRRPVTGLVASQRVPVSIRFAFSQIWEVS